MKAINYKPIKLLFLSLAIISPFLTKAGPDKDIPGKFGLTNIALGTISPLTYCAGDIVSVSFTPDDNANSGNVFSVMFWNTGTPLPPIVIGTLNSTATGVLNIMATIPTNTPSGSSYVIYVVSSSPVSSSTGSPFITINALTTASAGTYGSLTTTDPPVSLTGSPSGGTFSGTGVSGNSFDPSISGVGTFNITYSFTNANGCTSTDITTINVTCGFSAGSISGPSSACAYMGTGIDAGYTVVGAVNASSYSWSVVGSNLSTVAPTNLINGTIHYGTSYLSGYVKVTVGNGCGGSSVVLQKLTSSAIPNIPGTISGPTDVCAYLNAGAVTYSIAPILYATSYVWTLPSGVSGSSSGTSIDVGFPTGFGSGTIGVAAVNDCGSSAVKTLNVHSAANLPTLVTPTNATPICPPATITFSTSNTSGYTYTWAAPGTTGSSSTNQVNLTFPANPGGWGGGWITVTATNACGSSAPKSAVYSLQSGCRMQNNLGSVPPIKSNSIFPNPSTGNFTLVLNNDSKVSVAEVKIINEFGQLVYQSYERYTNGRIKLDLESKLINGVYLITCTVDGKKVVQKLLVNK